jgi:uncharacterized protein (TIGR00369 family)
MTAAPPAPRFAAGPEELLGPDAIARCTGLELMRGVLEGRFPAPPIARVLDFAMIEAEKGRAVFRGRPAFDFYNPAGSVHGGWFGALLDSCMGCAVQTMLPAGAAYTTLEYKVNIIRPLFADSPPVLAIGEARHAGRRTGVAEGRIVGEADGRLYATGSTTCMVTPLHGTSKGRDER